MHALQKNKKIFFLPVNTGYQCKNLPNTRCIEFYKERSSEELYCAIVGNVVIPNGYPSNEYCTFISDHTVWQELSQAIKDKGAKPGIQLSSSWPSYAGIKAFKISNTSKAISSYKTILKDVTLNQLKDVIENLTAGIQSAITAGFEHIQIHAAHGYLFCLMIDPEFCKYENFVQEEFTKIALSLKQQEIESSIRFSLLTGDKDSDSNRLTFITNLCQLPFDFFDISSGFYNINKHLIYADTDDICSERLKLSVELAKKSKDKRFILSGRSIGLKTNDLPENLEIGICRELIANPKILSNGNFECKECGKCHYYSNNEEFLQCNNWNTKLLKP